jgi:PD-(D/E)XK nuclease superfamily protein
MRTSVRIVSESTLKGAIAEAAIASAAIELGIHVLRPLAEGRRYDLVFDVGDRLLRVQCKWAPRKGNVIAVNLLTHRCTPRGHVRATYSAEEVDGIAIYCQELKECFYVPIEKAAGRAGMHLRLAPAANGQSEAINWAADYPLGAIAQLGERRAGSAKVVGSSPTSSTPNVRPLK